MYVSLRAAADESAPTNAQSPTLAGLEPVPGLSYGREGAGLAPLLRKKFVPKPKCVKKEHQRVLKKSYMGLFFVIVAKMPP